MKRAFDLVVGVSLLFALVPALLMICLWVRRDSPGPVFYRGVRVGRGGRRFRIFKFRTMVPDADRIGGPSTPDDDPRITCAGSVLRKFKLDEIPQVLNVIAGDMSFVGPRPEVPQYVAMYTEEERAILEVRPGVTDWATLWNSDEGALLAGAADPEKVYLEKIRPEKIRLQLEYMRKRSLPVDIQIMAQTLGLALGRALEIGVNGRR